MKGGGRYRWEVCVCVGGGGRCVCVWGGLGGTIQISFIIITITVYVWACAGVCVGVDVEGGDICICVERRVWGTRCMYVQKGHGWSGGGGGLQPTVCNGECLSVSLGLQSGLEQSPCPWWRGWVVWVSLEHLLMMLVTQRAGPVSMVERLGSLGFSGAPADDAQSGLVPT